MTSKPHETDSQTNIYIELVNRIYGKTKSMLDWPLYTLPQQRMSLTHFPLKGVLGVKGVLVAPRARARQNGSNFDTFLERAARGAPRTPFTLRNFSREIFFSIKWPVQHRFCFFRGLPGLATL